jgi:tetratricopeptide (TPR) repeat protein
MNNISDMINRYYGFRVIKDKVKFATIGKKSHPDYDRFQRHAEILKAAFELMDADRSLDAVKEKAQPALDFYASTAFKYSTGNKDQKKLKQICLYNLALAYCWLEDFDQAETFAKSILKFDTKNKDVKRLLEDIEYTRSSLANAGRASRHQVVVGDKT